MLTALQGSSLGVSAFHLTIGSYLAATEFLANATPRLANISSRLPLDEVCSFLVAVLGTELSPACHMYRTFLATISWAYGEHNLKTRGIEIWQEDITTIQVKYGILWRSISMGGQDTFEYTTPCPPEGVSAVGPDWIVDDITGRLAILQASWNWIIQALRL